MIIEIRDEVIGLSGALRHNRWRTLQSAVNVRLRYHPAGIIVDCGGLTALTAEGAETFRDAFKHIAASGGRMIIANLPPSLLMVIRQKASLGSQLPIAATISEARASLGLGTPTHRESRAGAGEGSAIVVGLLGTDADAHAVEVACRLGDEIYLAYLLVVPRNVPLLSPLGEVETEARAMLEGLDGAVRIRGMRPIPRVERTRDPARRLIEVAAEVRAEALVLALPPDAEERLTGIADAVMARAGCAIVIDRLPGRQKDLRAAGPPRPSAIPSRVKAPGGAR